ncbi:acyl carrier protein [Danxiaibacter flavus]|uniref:Acyl carrier protein n=1 Tax=Danxiaibacter flavus TaxID=3049108 RepID=A0ABV3ZEZ3_9BACT|nr:acyl carrier protein [Chitinophagaceae bacterium DXS]
MDFASFLPKFNEQLMEDDLSKISGQTKFRQLSSWDSLTAMAVITMIEDEYKVGINAETFKTFVTVEDIYNHVSSKIVE